MGIHLSSVSRLALATAAILATPVNASAAEFVVRNGQRVAASLEMPVAATESNVKVSNGETVTNANQLGFADVKDGQLINSGSVTNATVAKLGTLTNNFGGVVETLENAGTAVNAGQIGNVLQTAGNLTNNGIILGKATLEGGTLTNTKTIGAIETNAGTTFLNVETGQVKTLTNFGIATNNGAIQNVLQQGGTFTNDATGSVLGLMQQGGVSTNDGTITNLNMTAGTLTNNETGAIARATIAGGALLNSGSLENITVEALASLTNNSGGTIAVLTNSGSVTNAGQIGSVLQKTGSLTNNGTILGEATLEGGTLTNNNALGTVTVSAGASFVNNKSGIARALTNSGTSSNNGSIRLVDQKAGSLVNEANGIISGLTQSGGSTTNNGTIDRLSMNGGTLANNKDATIGDAIVSSGTVQNSGTITNLNLGKDSAFANNASGKVGQLVSSGTASNGGQIGQLAVLGGAFNNSGKITGSVEIGGGAFSSTGFIGGTLTNFAQSNIAGTINGGISNAVGAELNLIGKLTGEGNINNNGTINSTGTRDIVGFDAVINTGIMNIADDLSISGDVISSGTIRLTGNNAGGDSLNGGGDFALTQQSQTSLDIAADGTHDTLSAGGTVTLGGRLNITASGEQFALKSTYDAFTSVAGRVVGNFADVFISGAANLFGTVEQSETGLVLAIRNSDVLETQLNTLDLGENAKILVGLNYNGQNGAALFDALSAVETADSPNLIAQITGAATAAIGNIGSNAAKGFGNLIQNVATASGLRGDNRGVLAYEKARKAGDGQFEPVLQQGQAAVGFWARGFGETGSGDNNGNALIGGIGAGADIALGENLTLGISAGYSAAQFGEKSAIEGKTNSYHAGGYAALGATAPQATGFGLTASGSYSRHDTTSSRAFILGTLAQTANAKYGGSTIAGEVKARHGFRFGETVPLTIAPIAGLKFAVDTDDGYTETGSVSNLSVSAAKRKSLVGVIGLELATHIETDNVLFTPHISGVYQHEFLDTSSTTIRTLAGSSTPFTVVHGAGSRQSVAVEAGLGMRFNGGLAVDVSGYGVFADGNNRYGATATLKAGF